MWKHEKIERKKLKKIGPRHAKFDWGGNLRKLRASERKKETEKGEKIMLLIVATMFAWQPVCNATLAAPALSSDQLLYN